VTISCFNATSAPGTNTGKSYTYNGYAGTNNTVVDGTDDTVLSSFLATGTNKTLGASQSAASAGSTSSSTVQTVPGLTGAGGGQIIGGSGNSDSGSSSASAGAPSGTDSSSGSASTGSSSGFTQGDGSSGSSSKSGADKLGGTQERVMKGSLLAGIIAVAAMMAL